MDLGWVLQLCISDPLGQNGRGQLGNGNFDFKTAPIRVQALEGIRIVHAACGESHSLAVSRKTFE